MKATTRTKTLLKKCMVNYIVGVFGKQDLSYHVLKAHTEEKLKQRYKEMALFCNKDHTEVLACHVHLKQNQGCIHSGDECGAEDQRKG